MSLEPEATTETAIFAFGNFWGAEWVFSSWASVTSSRVGFARDHNTDVDVEAVEIVFDPQRVPYRGMVRLFLTTCGRVASTREPNHAPRTRPYVFTRSDEQHTTALEVIAELAAQSPDSTYIEPAWFSGVIVVPAVKFDPAPEADQRLFARQGLDRFFGVPAELRDQPRFARPPRPPAAASKTFAPALTVLIDLDRDLDGILGPTAEDEDSLIPVVAGGLLHDPDRVMKVTALARQALMAHRSTVDRADVSIDFLGAHTYVGFTTGTTQLTVACNLRPGNAIQSGTFTHEFARQRRPGPSNDASTFLTASRQARHRWMATSTNASRPPTPGDPDNLGAWHAMLAPATLPIAVEGRPTPHNLVWSDGELTTHDHDVTELERERTLEALSGIRCGCRAVLNAFDPKGVGQRWYTQPTDYAFEMPPWQEGHRWQEVPGTWAWSWKQFEADYLSHVDPSIVRHLFFHDESLADLDGNGPTADDQLKARQLAVSLLAELPTGFADLRLLRAMARLDEHRSILGPDDRTVANVLFYERLRPPLLDALWLPRRTDPQTAYAVIECRYLYDSESPYAEGDIDGDAVRIAVGAPFRWVTHVWTRGLAVIDDHLVLDVDGPPEADELEVVATTWDEPNNAKSGRLVTGVATAYWDGEEWHLR